MFAGLLTRVFAVLTAWLRGSFIRSLPARQVKWSAKMLNRLNNDKTARGGILRDAKEYGDSLDGLQVCDFFKNYLGGLVGLFWGGCGPFFGLSSFICHGRF